MCSLRMNKRAGAAMPLVICAMALVTVLCLSLLLGASVVMNSAQRTGDREQCRLLAVSLSQELQKQIVPYYFSTPEEETAADGTLWAYLKEKIGDGTWPYYNKDERGHTQRYAYRYLTLDEAGAAAAEAAGLEEVEILLYWSSERDAELDGSPLTVQVSCTCRGERCTVTSEYNLSYEFVALGGESEDVYNRWSWNLSWRE